MRRRLIKMFVLSCLALSLLIKPVIVSAENIEVRPYALSRNWIIVSISRPGCQYDGSCPYTPHVKPKMHYQNIYYQRTIVSDTGKITTEYKQEIEKLGCC